MADGEHELQTRRRTSPRLAAMAAATTNQSTYPTIEGLAAREPLPASSPNRDSIGISLGELSTSQVLLTDGNNEQQMTPVGTLPMATINDLRNEVKQWNLLSPKIKERAETLAATAWRPLVLPWPNLLVEAWIYVLSPGPRWTLITSNGGTYMITLDVLARKREEYQHRRHQEVQWFEDEMIPSLLEYVSQKRLQEINKEWGEVCHPLSNRIWFNYKCARCGKDRRLKTEHARTLLKCISKERRRCENLGLDCITPLTEMRYSPSFRMLESHVSNTGEVLPMIPESTNPWMLRGEARTPASRQERMETNAFAWTPHHDSNVVSILKALGKQGVSIKPYSGVGGGGVLQAWQEALMRHFRLFDLRGDEEQLTFASCFLEGEAREWWENLNLTGQIREINTIDDMVHHLREHFKPMHEDIKLSLEWRQTHQTGDINSYKRTIFQLQTQFPLGEIAEFCMTYHGLKKELRSPILAELWKRNARHLPLTLLFELAAQAEVATTTTSTLFPRFTERIREENRRMNQGQGNMTVMRGGGQGQQGGGWNARTLTQWPPTVRPPLQHQPRHDNRPIGQAAMTTQSSTQPDRRVNPALHPRTADQLAWMRQRPCWVCDRTGHLNQECPKKRDRGCMRCGGSHVLKDCPQRPKTIGLIQLQEDLHEGQEPSWEEIMREEQRIRGEEYVDAMSEAIAEQNEEQGTGEEELHTHEILQINKRNPRDVLKYAVKVRDETVEVIVDTGAQLSLMNKATALRCNIQWSEIGDINNVTTANGQPMKMLGKAQVHITKEGRPKEVEVYITESLQQQMILGLPWIRRYAPTIDWNVLTLDFKDGEVWNPLEKIPRCSLNGNNEEQFVEEYVLIMVREQEQGDRETSEEEQQDEEEIPEAIQHVLRREAAVFEPLQGIPPEDRVKHTIDTAPACRPVMKRPYRMSEEQDKEIEKQITEALDQGWLRPSHSTWGTAIFPVGKKTGEWRMCTDYRDLNALTELDAYPLPRIDDILHKVAKGRIFSTLDLQKGYHQIQIDEPDRHKTAFRLCRPVRGSSHFEWTVMPFGLKNAPPTFQRYMSLVLKDCSDCCEVYMDDIIIYSQNEKQHAQDLTRVLQALGKAQLKVRKDKCCFGRTKVKFLGHELHDGKIWMQKDKQKKISEWPSPLRNAKEVRRFMGMASYYRNYVPGFASIAAPLIEQTRKKKVVQWTWDVEQAFRQIKAAIDQHIARICWDSSLRTRLITDASGSGVGAVLEQLHDDEGWMTVAVWSRVLSPCQKNYSILDKEWMAILEAITRIWRHWLTGKSFEILTDHAPLVQILTKKVEELTPRQLRWLERMEPFSYEVKYIKGQENHVADALSRVVTTTQSSTGEKMQEIDYIEWGAEPDKLLAYEDIIEAQDKDELYKQALESEEIRDQLQVDLHNGLLRTKQNQVWVPFDMALRFKIILEHHDQPCMGHWNIRKTLALLERNYFWPLMSRDVNEVVETCDICQRAKIMRFSDSAPIRFIEAQYPWEVVTIDFVSGFKPTQRKHSAIAVVCDRYTRMIHLEPCNDHPTAKETARMVLRMVFARHGCPRIILSDRGTQFDSELWQQLWNMMGTRVHLASTHHPQTNGLTERMNRTLINLIRKTTNSMPHKWEDMLPLFEFAYNQTPNATTGVAPFVALNGQLPPTPAALLAAYNKPPDVSKGIQEYIDKIRRTYMTIHDIINNNEEQHQERIRRQYKQSQRKGLQLKEGDEVLVYWPPFEHYSTIPRKHRLRYAGPFKVSRVLTDACVHLEGLPDRMPNAINVEYLHRYQRPTSEELENLYSRQAP